MKEIKCTCGEVLIYNDGTLGDKVIESGLGGQKVIICDLCSWGGPIYPWKEVQIRRRIAMKKKKRQKKS